MIKVPVTQTLNVSGNPKQIDLVVKVIGSIEMHRENLLKSSEELYGQKSLICVEASSDSAYSSLLKSFFQGVGRGQSGDEFYIRTYRENLLNLILGKFSVQKAVTCVKARFLQIRI